MTGYEYAELENIRRILERGLTCATNKEYTDEWDGEIVDIIQHALDITRRLENEWLQEK